MKTKLARTGILVVVLLVLLLVASPQRVSAVACTSQSSGNWNNASRWSCGSVPTSADDVTIQAAHTITYDLASSTIQSLTVNGVLNFNAAANDSLTVTGNVTINSPSGVIAAVSASGTRTHTLNIGGNFTNNDTFTAVGGDDILLVVLNGTTAQTIGGSVTTTFENLTLSNTSAIISATPTTNALNVNGTMTVNAGAVFSPGANVVIGGATNTITGSGTIQVTRLDTTNAYVGQYQFSTDTLTNMTVDFAGAGDQEIDAQTYGSLRTSGSGTKTLAGSFTVNNGVTIGSGTTLNIGGSTLTIVGSFLTVNGTLDISNAAGIVRSSTSMTTLTMGANGLIRLVDSLGLGPATNAAFQDNTGSWDMTSLNTNGTVEYYGGNQTVTDRNYNNLILGGSGTKTWNLAANRNVIGNLTLSGTASLSLTGGSTLNISGNWNHSSSGTFTHPANGGTVNFNRNGTATLSRAGVGSTETFCNLTISANTTLDTGDDFVAVSGSTGCGTLTTNGVFRRTTTATVTNGGGTVSFNDALNNVTVQLTQTGGANMGNTSVIVSGNVISDTASFPCGSATLGGRPVRRYFNITPTNTTNITATVRLYWRDDVFDETNSNDPANVWIYHCNPSTSTWERLSGTYTRSGNIAGYNWVQLTNVTTFSPFAIGGGPGAPTAVTLSDFTAYPASSLPPILPSVVVGIVLSGVGGVWWWHRRAQR